MLSKKEQLTRLRTPGVQGMGWTGSCGSKGGQGWRRGMWLRTWQEMRREAGSPWEWSRQKHSHCSNVQGCKGPAGCCCGWYRAHSTERGGRSDETELPGFHSRGYSEPQATLRSHAENRQEMAAPEVTTRGRTLKATVKDFNRLDRACEKEPRKPPSVQAPECCRRPGWENVG